MLRIGELLSSTSSNLHPLPTATLFRAAFVGTVRSWQEARSRTLDGLKAVNYEKVIGAGKASYTHCTAIVRATLSDFVCDVEIVARKILSEAEFAYFIDFYRDANDGYGGNPNELRTGSKRMDSAISLRLGKAFINTGVFPIMDYLRPVDVRGRRAQDKPRPCAVPPKAVPSFQDEHVDYRFAEVAA